jgi:hypothetical protein
MKRKLIMASCATSLLLACAPFTATRGELPSLTGFTPGSAITSSIRSAYPDGSYILGPGPRGFETKQPFPESVDGVFTLAPGRYAGVMRSYCLHAGTYSPRGGDGFLIAPLEGSRATMIRGILNRSSLFQQIAQSDVQSLIWGIEAGVRFSDFPLAFQARVSPLLSPSDLASLAISVDNIVFSLLPGPLRELAGFYEGFRSKLTDARSTFEQIERVAVLTGDVPLGPDSRELKSDTWTLLPGGLYAKASSFSYSKTELEVIVPQPYRLQRDQLGRVIFLDIGDGFSVETSYQDVAGVLEGPNGQRLPTWKFAKVTARGPMAGQEHTILSRGFVVQSEAMTFGKPIQFLPSLLKAATTLTRQPGSSRFSRRQQTVSDWLGFVTYTKEWWDEISERKEFHERATKPIDEQTIHDLTDLTHYHEGVQSALSGGGLNWLIDHQMRENNALRYASCVIAGECPPPGATSQPEPQRRFMPSDYGAMPGNTSRQRLGLSANRYR